MTEQRHVNPTKTSIGYGGWFVERPYGEPGVYIGDCQTRLIAKIYENIGDPWQTPEEVKTEVANIANLIAAAPDLLQALTDLLNAEYNDTVNPEVIANAVRAIGKASWRSV
jgi:hypothetical protein